MAHIFLYTDLSPSRPWLFATIYANLTLLSKFGLKLGPLDPWSCELIPSHMLFWNPVPENESPPPGMAQGMGELSQKIEAGQNILLMSYSPHLLAHQSLARLLRSHVDLNKHEVRAVFVAGRPVCVFEQRWREARKTLSEAVGQAFTEQYRALSSIIMEARREWGENNVTLLPDLSDSPTAGRSDALAQSLFAALGCQPPIVPDPLPRHPLFLDSLEARRLSWALEVRDNAWPKLDERRFLDCLSMMERDWGTAPLSPRKLRQILIREGAADQRTLETFLELAPGSLDCPEWLATQAEADFFSPLPGDKIKAFASALPSAVRVPLRQRYALDASLLSEDQKGLAEALSAVASDETAVIGEPVPPVTLTVLTMTYNHEAYIAECMDGVLAQRTDFSVQHLVLDHHSTDRTAGIVAAYAARHPSIRPVILSQRRPFENVTGLFSRCRTTYAALCDGDDYFTDPFKLQKQVDFLESHPHCALCFHPVSVVFENGEQPGVYPPPSMLPRGVREEYYLADMFQGNLIQTNSVVYRWRFRDGRPEWFRPDLCPGDWYWHLLHAEMGKIGFLPKVMSVYRRHKNAVYSMAFISPIEHHRIHGMTELSTYQAFNEHFHGRYFRRLAMLANDIFADFFKIYSNEGDKTLLDQASKNFPGFACYFLQSLKVVRKKRPGLGVHSGEAQLRSEE